MIFVLDTSTQFIGMCLYDGNQVKAEHIWQSHSHHTVELVPAIKYLFTQAGVTPSDLSGLGVALGPGSFTSLRIGLSVIKGLALGCTLPVVGIPSLDILAAGQPALALPMMAILSLGRGRLASARYEIQDTGWVYNSDLLVGNAHDLARTIDAPIYICGEMDQNERQILGRKWKTVHLATPALCVRRPVVLAELTRHRLENGKADSIETLAPIYVHTLSDVPSV